MSLLLKLGMRIPHFWNTEHPESTQTPLNNELFSNTEILLGSVILTRNSISNIAQHGKESNTLSSNLNPTLFSQIPARVDCFTCHIQGLVSSGVMPTLGNVEPCMHMQADCSHASRNRGWSAQTHSSIQIGLDLDAK